MLFGRYINRYYLKYLPLLLLGVLALLLVDVFQLRIPELYRLVVNGIADGGVTEGGVFIPFDAAFLLDRICRPMLFIILALVLGRFLWRVLSLACLPVWRRPPCGDRSSPPYVRSRADASRQLLSQKQGRLPDVALHQRH